MKIGFDKVDSWFEEDEEIFVHPKDPYKVCQLTRAALITALIPRA